ncbi:hypothetical protein Dimus_012783 [Dionaea muscipula]
MSKGNLRGSWRLDEEYFYRRLALLRRRRNGIVVEDEEAMCKSRVAGFFPMFAVLNRRKSLDSQVFPEHDKKIKAISGNKENVLLLDSKRSLAQRAQERLERTGILQPRIDETHPADNKLKRKIVEKQCLTYTSSVNCDSDGEMRRSNIISNVSGI